MKKRIFTPLWKAETIEKELSKLESEGWRLKKISGIRTFEFVSAKPKNTDYILLLFSSDTVILQFVLFCMIY